MVLTLDVFAQQLTDLMEESDLFNLNENVLREIRNTVISMISPALKTPINLHTSAEFTVADQENVPFLGFLENVANNVVTETLGMTKQRQIAQVTAYLLAAWCSDGEKMGYNPMQWEKYIDDEDIIILTLDTRKQKKILSLPKSSKRQEPSDSS